MKTKLLAVILAVSAIFCMGGVTAYAATTAAKPASIFDGYKLSITDKTTPAVNISGGGTAETREIMYFRGADGKVLGSLSRPDFWAIIKKYEVVVKLDGGGTYGAPPVKDKRWEEWFADEFNKYRGLDDESREKAAAEYAAELVNSYRQKVISLVNAEREKAGLAILYADEKAMEYAQIRAKELLTSYSHTRPDGLQKPNDELGAINENIARGQFSPEEVVDDWMKSPGHRSNILNKEAFAIGVGCHWTGTSFYWSQEFLW